MIKHKQIFCDFFGYTEADFIPCECGCSSGSVDIHHISKRGMGGSRFKDLIWNLAGVTRECHNKADNDVIFNERIRENHERKVVEFALANPKRLEWFLKKYPENKTKFENEK